VRESPDGEASTAARPAEKYHSNSAPILASSVIDIPDAPSQDANVWVGNRLEKSLPQGNWSTDRFLAQHRKMEVDMKSISWRLCLALTLLALCFPKIDALGQERSDANARLERLERRVNEMADRQEQLLRRLESGMDHRGGASQPPGDMRPPMPNPGAPMAGPQNPHAAKMAKSIHDTLGLLILVALICNVLLTIWIFTDIRKRGEGSGIFVAMALVAGVPAALIYALTRIGDKKA
jgi:hypothetical protein